MVFEERGGGWGEGENVVKRGGEKGIRSNKRGGGVGALWQLRNLTTSVSYMM